MTATKIRRSLTASLAAVAVATALLLASAPAFAHHDLTLRHQPPPGALRSQPLELAAVVHGSCTLIGCGPIRVTLEYVNGESDTPQRFTTELPSRSKLARFVVPADDVLAGFAYSITATQDGGWHSHGARVRSPQKGRHTVFVTGPETAVSDVEVEAAIRYDGVRRDVGTLKELIRRSVSEPTHRRVRSTSGLVERTGRDVQETTSVMLGFADSVGRSIPAAVDERALGSRVDQAQEVVDRVQDGAEDRVGDLCPFDRYPLDACVTVTPVSD